ncbi:MAG: hypothetical protein IPM38_15945 [Ignavibacteria bacterium]|nr:hypothetical protein [Ignavibacteria bacterium]
MEKITIILLLYLISVLESEAQWILQSSFTNSNLYDVEFYNRNTGWAVGDGGTILKTTNGGTNWITFQTLLLANLYRVFTSLTLIFVMSWDGLKQLLKQQMAVTAG